MQVMLQIFNCIVVEPICD
uniref:Uncharacterized protein n=1 Tax=Rhizophora mucronata TaxID=61149 RepID=A0A2P2Q9I5_RHIMU